MKGWVIGAPYSGTRYLYNLLDMNTGLNMLDPSPRNKHGPNDDLPKNTEPVIIYKHPLAWIPSVWKRADALEIPSLIRWWTMSYDVWEQRFDGPFIHYSSLLKDKEATIGSLGLEQNSDWFTDTDEEFDDSRYLDKKYLDDYRADELATARRYIDAIASGVLNRMGYNIDS